MDMQSAIRCVVERQDLTEAQMLDVMRLIMTGQATPAQIGGFLVGVFLVGTFVGGSKGGGRRRTVHNPHNLHVVH